MSNILDPVTGRTEPVLTNTPRAGEPLSQSLIRTREAHDAFGARTERPPPEPPNFEEVPKADPLHPRAGEFLSQSILAAGEAYIESILSEYRRHFDQAENFLEGAEAWAEGERKRIQERAEDVASAHAELVEAQNRFYTLPRAKDASQQHSPSRGRIEPCASTLGVSGQSSPAPMEG